jgi:superoxide dismutase
LPYSSDAQRGFMHAVHPRIAARWDAEARRGAQVGPARTFPDLIDRGLVGISDQVLRDHLRLYEAECATLAALEQAKPQAWRVGSALPAPELQGLLASRICDLQLVIDGQLAEAIAQVEGELQAKGITWKPNWYLGESDFWTTDQATSINLPWYLANEQLWQLVNEHDIRLTREDVVAILRHELGHALGYAFEIWKEPLWRKSFGDFFQPYTDDYTPDPTSTDFVRNLHDAVAAPNAHYAQKHPDEDWAETFAVWLDPGSRWQEAYAAWPGALQKLEVVDLLLVSWGRAYGQPINRAVGRTVPYQTLTYTIGEYLGLRSGPDPADAVLSQLPYIYDGVVLHELYFEALARPGPLTALAPAVRFAQLAGDSFGSMEAWAADFRQACRAASGWALAVYGRDGRLRNVVVEGHDRGVPANAAVMLACDLWEHAYAGDYGTRRDAYVAAWWRNIDWGIVDSRVNRVLPPPVVMLPTVSIGITARAEDPTVQDPDPLL